MTSRRTTTTGCTIHRMIPFGISRSCGTSTAGRRRRCSTSRDGTTTTTGRKARPRTTLGSCSRAEGDTSRAALLLGPWIHGVDSTSRTTFGERDFGGTAAIDYDEVVLGWMDRHLRGRAAPSAAAPVRYFVMGENRWRESSTWPPPGHAAPTISLGRRRRAHGRLTQTRQRVDRATEHLSLYPADPVINPYSGQPALTITGRSPSGGTCSRSIQLRLTRDLEVTGSIRVRVYISCDCRDTDLWVRILDVAPDGSAST